MRGWADALNRILKPFMAATGVVLLVLLLGKAAGQAKSGWWPGGLDSFLGTQAARCLELAWEQTYPALEAPGQWVGDGLEAMADWLYPRYGYLRREIAKNTSFEEIDPSYKMYQECSRFYEEHQFLAWYGDEETNEGKELAVASGNGGGGTQKAQGAAGMAPEVPKTLPQKAPGSLPVTPAYCQRPGLPVIGTKYVLEQLVDYDFLMKHFYTVHTSTTASRSLMNAKKFLSEDFTLKGSNKKPQILIYHTHSQETFADFGPNNKNATVVGMGSYLAKLLTAKGYNVIHDKSVYDLVDGKLDRNKAYTYSLEGVTRILQKNPSIEVLLDLHRDGVKEGYHMVHTVNGKPTAPIMFFNGVSQTPEGPIEYLPNPYREDNLAFSLQMQLDAAAYYPGLTRKIYIKGLRYNMHLRPRSALIEVGAQTNTYQEARNAMEPLSELLDMVLQGN